jgi:uncharacterized membrane protein
VLFVIVPWIGVMMTGYAFGAVMQLPAKRRRAVCIRLGVALTALFILLRGLDVYGDPRHWKVRPAQVSGAGRGAAPANLALPPAAPTPASASPSAQAQQAGNAPPRPGATTGRTSAAPNTRQVDAPRPQRQPALLRFLGTNKYPASLLFLLMTLGPMFIALGLAEHAHGRVSRMLSTFGRVPLFYYLLHIPLIHAAACVVSLIREGSVNVWLFTNHPMAPGELPSGYMWSLPLLYLVFGIVVVLLYFPCRWFARLRATRASPWLSYL